MSQAPPATGSSIPAGAARVHLRFLDGLRGLAALYVVLSHACSSIGWPRSHEALAGVAWATAWMGQGHLAVSVFIVLSGYCLMLPVARAAELPLRGGVAGFVARRSRRILPPYFAALALCLGLIFFVPGLGRQTGHNAWDVCLPAFEPGPLLSHLFLVHNLSPEWQGRIDYPMWSVATEWQIYFAFALILLPVWRRFGTTVGLVTAAALGVAPHFVSDLLDPACFHYVLLFAFGMAAATLKFPQSGQTWGWIAVGFFAVCLLNLNHPIGPLRTHGWMNLVATDVLAGVACGALIAAGARQPAEGGGILGTIVRGLSCGPVVTLGAFSYSLYLVHAPILALVDIATPREWTALARLLFMLGAGVGGAVVFAYGFHRIFERPFMPGHPRREQATAYAAAVSPAP